MATPLVIVSPSQNNEEVFASSLAHRSFILWGDTQSGRGTKFSIRQAYLDWWCTPVSARDAWGLPSSMRKFAAIWDVSLPTLKTWTSLFKKALDEADGDLFNSVSGRKKELKDLWLKTLDDREKNFAEGKPVNADPLPVQKTSADQYTESELALMMVRRVLVDANFGAPDEREAAISMVKSFQSSVTKMVERAISEIGQDLSNIDSAELVELVVVAFEPDIVTAMTGRGWTVSR